ncbi:hypothetical protein KAX17_11080 [Candidatus Bipolaricaulota bacterium]|nr:hypothetical protein [Candidatus Bipolaricaulota bacterium]MCK4599236.1 hypothetical protein [Candidatus Bipolaricaulota bacterium]
MGKKKKRRAKRRVMGVLGKAGVAVMALPPIAGSALGAIEHVWDMENIPIVGKIQIGFATWLNGLAHGFGMSLPYGTLTVKDVNGTARLISVTVANVPKNLWWTTTGLGAIMIAQDRIIAWAMKRAVKLPGTNIVLTGSN